MDYVRLGNSGLKVSRLCLGCMSYGDPQTGPQPWALSINDSRPFFRAAVEAGINFFDTADTYSWGASEEIVGEMIREFSKRDAAVIATKVFAPSQASPSPNDTGLSRKRIFAAIDDSLRRLKMDYVDLYQIHRFDRTTPIEETMEALNDVVQMGKARYIGASSMYAYQFVHMQGIAERRGWTKFVSMQNLYNLVWREEEKQMNAFCVETGVGLVPWSPLAGGFLAVDWREAGRSHSDRTRAATTYASREHGTSGDYAVVDALAAVSARLGRTMSEVALAWVRTRPGVSAPIVGATKMSHLDAAINSLDLALSPEDVVQLEDAYSWNRQLGMLF